MGDIHAFERPRRFRQMQHFLQSGEALFRIDGKNFRLHVGAERAALVERFEHFDFVAEPARLLEIQFLRGGGHLLAHFGQQRLLLAFQNFLQPLDVLAVLFLA